jgi:hypothetical protein
MRDKKWDRFWRFIFGEPAALKLDAKKMGHLSRR